LAQAIRAQREEGTAAAGVRTPRRFWMTESDHPQAEEEPEEVGVEENAPEAAADEAGKMEATALSAKTLANRRRKEKKKAKKQEAAVHGDDSSSSTTEAPPEPCARKKGQELAAAKARERVQMQKMLEEQRREAEEAERRRVEEEERKAREAELAAEAERAKKQQAKAAKVAAAKAEGTYLTKAQKQKAAKAAQFRQQLVAGTSMPCQPKTPSSEITSPKQMISPKVSGSDVSSAGYPQQQQAASSSATLQSGADEECLRTSAHRSPVVCILGHVDAGKTKLLDKIRRTHVQEREAGGITQQIGATFFPRSALCQQCSTVDPAFEVNVPGLLIIDTPGHASFANLRSRGSTLCDLAVVVVDVMHGLQVQAVEAIKLLQKQNCPFLVALNKMDVLYQWKSEPDRCVRTALAEQEELTQQQFQKRLSEVVLELNERGLNASVYWENSDPETCLSLVPTSARTGEGIPDLLHAILQTSQSTLLPRLELTGQLRGSVMEVKHVDGLGTTIDVLLLDGSLHEGDNIVLAGFNGPIATSIRALLTPQPMKEMRVKGEYCHHTSIRASMGVKISAAGLDRAVAGSEIFRFKEDEQPDPEALLNKAQSSVESALASIERQAAGVYVKASTVGSLEALLSFLQEMEVPVFDMSIGDIHRKDVMQAAIMKEKKFPEYAMILAFDVKVAAEARKEAKHLGVQIFTADVIYHLFEQFQQHLEKTGRLKSEDQPEAIFPVILSVSKPCALMQQESSDLLWCEVESGQLRIGTPLCLHGEGNPGERIDLDCVGEIFKDRKPIQVAFHGDRVCIKLTRQDSRAVAAVELGVGSKVASRITRDSCHALKEQHHGELRNHDWATLELLKRFQRVD